MEIAAIITIVQAIPGILGAIQAAIAAGQAAQANPANATPQQIADLNTAMAAANAAYSQYQADLAAAQAPPSA